MRATVITDMQDDFIAGSLAVPDADNDAFRSAVLNEAADADVIVASQDWHPEGHCSFEAEGGPWPEHCVRGTIGASLDPHVATFLLAVNKPVYLIRKGWRKNRDAYSVFSGLVVSDVNTRFELPRLDQILEAHEIEQVRVVGLAFDVCVRATALDAIDLGYETVVPLDATRAVKDETAAAAEVDLVAAGALLP